MRCLMLQVFHESHLLRTMSVEPGPIALAALGNRQPLTHHLNHAIYRDHVTRFYASGFFIKQLLLAQLDMPRKDFDFFNLYS